jgi:hypothetical protein
VRCDGISNAKTDKLEHDEKAEFPSVETEEGTMKEAKMEQDENASNSVVGITAGDSNMIPLDSEQFAKQRSSITRTESGICIEQRSLQL